MGILYALMQRDLKVLLAYSTVENIGVVAIGLGLAIVFRANGLLPLAALALAASLFHVLNHALMKSLLFFAAGAVQVATATTDMERLGGLIHRLPRTAILALCGAIAIAALPPFNGFVSEWLTFQAILTAPSLPQWVLKFGVPVAGVLLALSAALAAACFVNAYGITFLGRPRSPEAAKAGEVEPVMVGVMAYLAGLCLLIGLLPTFVLIMLNPAVERVMGVPFPTIADGVSADEFLYLAPLGFGRSSYSGLIVLAVVAVVTLAVIVGVRRPAVRGPRRAAPWDCGFPDPSPATQYTASSFAQPLRRVFGTVVFRAREEVDMPEPGQLRPASFSLRLTDVAWQGFYAPVQSAVSALADRLNVLQFLTIRRYLVLMFTALIVLLLAVAFTK
jgi:NADH:ubiquinone oxidoreductase subunit 5 (subunit L)/multisubunit Na+/H+ antiporter MnhA subunit